MNYQLSCCHTQSKITIFSSPPQKNEVNLLHIESRSSKRTDGAYEFMVECDSENCGDLPKALEEVKGIAKYFNVISREYKDNAGNALFKGCFK